VIAESTKSDVILAPIENALEEIQGKVKQLTLQVTQKPTDKTMLQLVLQVRVQLSCP
jgi:hypothetical protein